MNKAITDAQYSTLIGVIARVPVEEARRLVLERVEAALPKAGKVKDAQMLAAINDALRSFPPGAYQGDENGFFPTDMSALTLAALARLYQRMLRLPTVYWPPKQPPTPEQLRAQEAKIAS